MRYDRNDVCSSGRGSCVLYKGTHKNATADGVKTI
nr:MAG TPA_asm: hypothetical protein [Caudoviricetes sp.]